MQPSQDQKQGHSDPKSYNLMNTVQHTQRTYTGNSREKLHLVLFVIWGYQKPRSPGFGGVTFITFNENLPLA